jgi:DNA-binding NarL/FixJ family response regulator
MSRPTSLNKVKTIALSPGTCVRSTALESREKEVILGILGGLTNKSIGAQMGISESSVKNIVRRVFDKTGVRTRSQIVRLALEGSLPDVGPVGKRPHKATRLDLLNSSEPARAVLTESGI